MDSTATRLSATADYCPVAHTDTAAPLSTIIIDSIAADTVSGRVPHFVDAATADSLRQRADSLAHVKPVVEVACGSREGILPAAAIDSPANSTALAAILGGVLIVTGLCFPMVIRALRSYRKELWSVRRRPNVFDDEHTASLPAALLLSVLFAVFGGMVLYYIDGRTVGATAAGPMCAMLLAAAYTLFQRAAYTIVGYAFTSPARRRRWLAGYSAAQAYAAIGFIIPVMLLVYSDVDANALITICLAVYFASRVIFVVKGFRIFYSKIRSLLYFILYLCTLEIIPLIALYGISMQLLATVR